MQNKKSLLFASTALMLGALAGCGGNSGDTRIVFWTGFGGAVNSVLEPLLAEYEDANPGVDILYETKGGYDNLKQAIDLSVSNEAYPHIANGYPDHFASYINSNIMVMLDGFIADEETGVDIDDFYSDYLKENQELVYEKNPDGTTDKTKPRTVGLPFNKSTEVMIVNDSFFEVMTAIDSTVKVPETWDEIATIGAKIKTLAKDNGFFGKVVVRDGDNFTTTDRPSAYDADFAETVMFDFTDVTESNFRPFNWDSEDNFFITLVRQFGGTYSSVGETIRDGQIHFNSAEVVTALTEMQDLYKAGIVGIPETYGESLFASNPFKKGQLVMTVSSSAGVKENLPDTYVDYPFEVGVHPIPYKTADKKFVISQGTNLAIFQRGSAEEKAIAWDLLKFLTVEKNDVFGIDTGYFPVTKTAQEGDTYSDFLNGDPEALNYTSGQKIVQDSAILNNDTYMDDDADWIKFADPGFVGSSDVRLEVGYIMGKVFTQNMDPQRALNEAYARLSKYVND